MNQPKPAARSSSPTGVSIGSEDQRIVLGATAEKSGAHLVAD
jgi:hypothetical protein